MSCIGRRNQKIGDVEFEMRRGGGEGRVQRRGSDCFTIEP